MNVRTDLIGEMVAEDFRTAAVFKKYGIDFCCKGGRTITEACEKKEIDQEKVYKDLENLPASGQKSIDFTSWPLDLLADYVEKTHHRYVEDKTPILQQFLDKLCKVHGDRHPELFEITEIFNESAQEMAAHMKKEELILFPFIRNIVKAKQTGGELRPPHFGSVENPVNMMMHDHTAQGELFERISELTDAYVPPADACNTYRVTYQMLAEFDDDLHTHIHLENNILFPKSVEMEKEFHKEA